MRVAIVGGKLQGVEAAYLAKKAGWEVLLVDRRPQVPAIGLCDRLAVFAVASERDTAGVLADTDLVIPALEDLPALRVLSACARAGDIRLAFDLDAFRLTASKVRSNRLFQRLGVPVPAKWPHCDLPVIVKPDRASGSRGVRLITRARQLAPYTNRPNEYVIEAFAPGPTFSIEVMGVPGRYYALQVTALEMDAGFDCKRVWAPAELKVGLRRRFEELAVRLARAVGLKGVMDVEVVHNGGELALLEIDARLPSQTPTAVYWSTGVNMVAMLERLFVGGGVSPPGVCAGRERAVVYEHIRVDGTRLETAGEHIMAERGPLEVKPGFFGADEALVSSRSRGSDWVATLVFADRDRRAVRSRRDAAIAAICRHCGLDTVIDAGPAVAEPGALRP